MQKGADNTTEVVVACIVATVALLFTITALVVAIAFIRHKRRKFRIKKPLVINGSQIHNTALEERPEINIDDCYEDKDDKQSKPRDHLNLQLGDKDPSSGAKAGDSSPQITNLQRGVKLLGVS